VEQDNNPSIYLDDIQLKNRTKKITHNEWAKNQPKINAYILADHFKKN